MYKVTCVQLFTSVLFSKISRLIKSKLKLLFIITFKCTDWVWSFSLVLISWSGHSRRKCLIVSYYFQHVLHFFAVFSFQILIKLVSIRKSHRLKNSYDSSCTPWVSVVPAALLQAPNGTVLYQSLNCLKILYFGEVKSWSRT